VHIWIVKSDVFWTFWFNKMKFCQGIMMSYVIIFEIWVALGLSLNTIRVSQILVHLQWYCDYLSTHVKGINNSIHPIISFPQTISLPIYWHVGKSICPCLNTKCLNTHQIMEGKNTLGYSTFQHMWSPY
jgi:hypothetical protein